MKQLEKWKDLVFIPFLHPPLFNYFSLFLSVYVNIYMYVYMYMSVCVPVFEWVCVCVWFSVYDMCKHVRKYESMVMICVYIIGSICIHVCKCMCIYIYIYILSLRKNTNRSHKGYKFISILLCVFDKIKKHKKKFNRTSSDLMDKINRNRHRKEGWEGIEEGWRVISSFSPLPFFILLSVRIIVN